MNTATTIPSHNDLITQRLGYSGWFHFQQENGQGTYGTIYAATTQGAVFRSRDPGFIVLAGGRKLSAELAMASGLLDQAALDYLMDMEGAYEPAPAIREDHRHPDDIAAEKGPAYAGTPVEPVVSTLLALLVNRGDPKAAEAFATALESTFKTK